MLLTTGILGFLVSHIMQNFFYNQTVAELVDKGESLINLINEGQPYHAILRSLGEPIDTSVIIIDPMSGAILGKTTHAVPIDNKLGRIIEQPDFLEAIRAGEVVIREEYSEAFGEVVLTVAVPNVYNGRVKEACVLYAPLAGLSPLMQKLLSSIHLSALGVAVIALLGAYWLSKTLLAPIQEMTKTAHRLSSGDFSKRINLHGEDEVGQLAKAFNRMIDGLQDAIRKLSLEKNRIQHVISNMAEGVIVVSTDNHIVLANSRALQLYNVNENDISDLPIADWPESVDLAVAIEIAISEGETCTVKSEIDSTNKSVIIHASPLRSEIDEQWGAVVVIQDITELENIERLRQQFVANVSHELRTPLYIIRGFAEAVIDDIVTEPAKQKEYLGNIIEETDRLNRLVTDLLDLAQIQSGNLRLKLKQLDVEEIVNRAIFQLQGQAQEKKVSLTSKIQGELPQVVADADRVIQILVNLVANGLEYTPQGGSVVVSAEVTKDQNYVKIKVSDTGVGIPKEHLELIWERFHKVQSARTPTKVGSGLGLSIVKSLVEAHNGEVEVESVEGKGSTFAFTLPTNRIDIQRRS
ncbi:MAG: cell wall metabolism sensor histidine kinase WalK [Firmicutes bacterium]|nr:cell wall metabolism sensor histidine kinase WalK [Bacillota bacterium]